MTAHETDKDFIVFFSAEELDAHALRPEDVTCSQLLPFLRTYLAKMQKTLPLHPSIELFTSQAGLLVFIRSAFSYFPNSSMNQRIFS